MADLHSVTLEWPHGGANNVILTGTFDHWASSIRLDKQGSSYKGTVRVPWNQKVAYKFIVDGEWRVNDKEPTEKDPAGNLNNIYVAPKRPAELPKSESTQADTVSKKVEETPVNAPSLPNGKQDISAQDVAQTVLATEGTKSVVDYLVSGVGAVIQGVLGVDPINADKLPVQTPKTELPETPVTGVREQIDDTAKDAGVQNHDHESDADTTIDTKTKPLVNDTTTSTEAPKTSEPAQTLPVLPVVSSVDPTLASPPKEVVASHGPSTHTPGGVAESSTGTATTVAEPPTVGSPEALAPSEAKLSTPPPAQPLSPAQAPTTPIKAANGNNAHQTNGAAATSTSTPPGSRGASPSPTPSTPSKGKHSRFPSFTSSHSSPKSDKSPSSSRSKTISRSGSLRGSLKGLRRISLKAIFGHGKDKEEKEEEK